MDVIKKVKTLIKAEKKEGLKITWKRQYIAIKGAGIRAARVCRGITFNTTS